MNDVREAVRVRVDGMTCRSCERLLLLNVQALEGVEAASVDAESGSLLVFVDPSRVSVNDIRRAVVASGLFPTEADSERVPWAPRGKSRERMAVHIEGEDYVI